MSYDNFNADANQVFQLSSVVGLQSQGLASIGALNDALTASLYTRLVALGRQCIPHLFHWFQNSKVTIYTVGSFDVGFFKDFFCVMVI
jgi:hypothetical protein